MLPNNNIFWRQDCGARGAALSHTHHGHVGEDPQFHFFCPCRHCGLTPERWGQLVHYRAQEADIVDPDDRPLALPQPETVQEPSMAGGVYAGSEDGPGRGALTERWKSWARVKLTPIDSEYR